jgi:protein phosphatase
MVQTLIETGKISPDDAKKHPRKNVITRALGVEAEVVTDFNTQILNSGDTLLLCTDGLTNFVRDDEIFETFSKNNISQVSQKLVDLANENGGGDNITVVTLTAQ